jgi:hypothetical protein
MKSFLEAVSLHVQKGPSTFVWNADETRVGAPKREARPEVIVASRTDPETLTVAEERDDNQLSVLTAISAFGGSIPPMFISKRKTFESGRLAEEQLFHGHDDVIRQTAKTFVTETLFTDWLQTQFICRRANRRTKMNYSGPVILLVDEHASHLTPRVMAFAGSAQIVLIRRGGYSSHIRRPLDMCVFGLLKMLDKKEQKSKGLRGGTLKIYRVILASYTAPIIPMVRWTFLRAGFHLNQMDIFAPLTVTPNEVLNRIAMPEIGLEKLVFPRAGEDSRATGSGIRRPARIPGLLTPLSLSRLMSTK